METPESPRQAPHRIRGTLAAGILGLALVAWGCAQTSGTPSVKRAPDDPPGAPYTRCIDVPEGVDLEVALRRFVPRSKVGRTTPPVEVWLVAVTHLGTSNYYARLQRFLDGQDLVLYEGIGATQGQFRADASSGFSLQPALAKALGLRFQLSSIDYRRPGWVNSDLGLRDLEKHLPRDGPGPDVDTLMAAFAGEGAVGGIARMGIAVVAASPRLQALSRLMLVETLGRFAGELPQGSGSEWGLDTEALFRALVLERNAVVVQDLRRALRRRSPPARVAIFYGAGHMPDLERRLRRDLGLVPVEERWMRAFGARPQRAGLTELEVEWVRESVRREISENRQTNGRDKVY